ncbi:MAG: hemagglutinin repeat-containing protein [Sideroxyarcus sp.]|nr:hemagglutinin repeat-containing protein [Sideroxyarcus sp.]
MTWDASNRRSDSSRTEAGTAIQVQGELHLQAGSNIDARAASIASDGAVTATAGNDIRLVAGQSSRSVDEAHQHTSRNGMLSSKTVTTRDTFDDTTSQATTVSGNRVTLRAGNNIQVTGSNVASDQGTQLAAGQHIDIAAATDTRTQTHTRQEKKSGIFSAGGVGLSIGTQRQGMNSQATSTTAAASTVGSTQGDVTLTAGQAYRQTGSDVIALTGDVNIAARQVAITEARESSRSSVEHSFQQSGITVAVTNPVISAVQTARQMQRAVNDTDDARAKVMAGANVAASAHSALAAIKAGQGSSVNGKEAQLSTGKANADGSAQTRDANAADKVGGIDIAISLGSSKSQSRSTSTSESARGASVVAGGDINISANANAANANASPNASAGIQPGALLVQGSVIAAGGSVKLQADQQISLLAAQNTSDQHSSNKASSASIGVSFGTSGLLATASASAARGNVDGADTSWTNAQVNAGNRAVLQSGGDATLKGAVVTAPQVTANIGGNLRIESLQDSSRYDSQQQSIGGSIALGAGNSSGSVNAGKSDVNSRFASVAEQSGLKAGDSGFDVSVARSATLTGGAITSTQQAIDQGSNRFDVKGSIALADMGNQASSSARSASINIGTGFDPSGKLAPAGTSAGFGRASDNASSTTQAAVSGIAGITAARTGDGASGISNTFDADKVQRDIAAQTQITQTFGRLAPKAVADYAGAQAREARTNGNLDEARKWEEGGAYRIALQTAVGGLAGAAAGAAGAAVAAGAAPLLEQLQHSIAGQLQKAGAGDALAKAAAQLVTGATAAGMGAVAGGGSVAGAAMGLNVDANNRQLHQSEFDKAKKFARQTAQALSKKENRVVTEQEAEGRIVAEMLRNSDKQTADAVGGKDGIHDYNIRSIVGCQHLNCDGYRNDPQYANAEFNVKNVAPNQAAHGAGQAQLGTGQSYRDLVAGNIKQDPVGTGIAAVGMITAGGYVLAPAVAAMGAEAAAFLANPLMYCRVSPAACVGGAEAAAAIAAGVPVTGAPGLVGVGKGVVAEVKGGSTQTIKSGKSALGWPGSGGAGPVPGTIGITDNTAVDALKNYSPKGGGVEFVYDPSTNTFVAGRPSVGLFSGSPHEQLAQSIGAANRPIVGGTFHRGANGEIITNENSGHYGQNWTDPIRQKFQIWLNSRLGLPVTHINWSE